jgi:hypothetical protein
MVACFTGYKILQQIILPFQNFISANVCVVSWKVTLSLSMPWKYVGEAEVELHSFLTWTLDGGEWSVNFTSLSLYSGEGILARFK